jgi:hypothetical protein
MKMFADKLRFMFLSGVGPYYGQPFRYFSTLTVNPLPSMVKCTNQLKLVFETGM